MITTPTETDAEIDEEITRFARDYDWMAYSADAPQIDPTSAADQILSELDAERNWTPEARAKLRSALVTSAERENAYRARAYANRYADGYAAVSGDGVIWGIGDTVDAALRDAERSLTPGTTLRVFLATGVQLGRIDDDCELRWPLA